MLLLKFRTIKNGTPPTNPLLSAKLIRDLF